ncbi:MAG: penicillin-binding transpeptidase domain-containing protein, partial [Coriobacteriia bacterium]|nr:penicillin-binding transpeptidase domain-containing protein [Coriobacteriia bacterium]
MRPEVITVIVGVATFLVAVLAILLVLDIRSRQKKDVVVKQSFGPAAPPKGSVSIDIQKDQGMTNEPPQDKNRSRFYVFGVLAAGVFGALMVKLWQLQLLSGDTYIREAEKNRTEQVSLPAIRGRLLDRKGRELVGNRPSLQVTAPRSVADDRNLVHRLSLVLGIPKGALRLKLLDERVLITANRILATDVSMRAAAYIQSHPTLFPEVSIEAGTRRYYPYGTLAAHVLGYIDRVTNDDLDKADDAFTYEGNDYIGRVGAESYFEEHLRGTKGTRTYQVDAGRRPVAIVDETPAINGDDVCLTIDLDLQRATDSILPQIIASAREIGREWCNAGALVAMDIEDGGILAMSSYPTFDPMPFTRGISQDLWDQLNNEAANTPLLNRVTSGRYPAASTFKAFGTLAGLHSGLIDDGTTCYCDGTWTVYGEDWAQFCWTHPYGYGHGYLDLEEAVNQSC